MSELRCRPEELCWIRKSPMKQNLNKFVETVRLVGDPLPEHRHLGALWHVKSRMGIVTENGQIVHFAQVPDDWLTPVRDPGADAVDETLQGEGWKRTEAVVRPTADLAA
jgi:hypothetical protein